MEYYHVVNMVILLILLYKKHDEIALFDVINSKNLNMKKSLSKHQGNNRIKLTNLLSWDFKYKLSGALNHPDRDKSFMQFKFTSLFK